MKRNYKIYIKDIQDNILNIDGFIEEMSFDDFEKDKKTLYAVSRCFEIIGESVSYLSEEVKVENKEIPWQKIRDFRNIIVHKYWMLDAEIMWDIIKNYLPELKEKINKISIK